ncbi:hypothetical protein BST42_27370 [Mycolicibacterium rhodesiae]|uniref:Uncharacterized protein n=1 Tax=Mycolicibacterium rhodesiae TaxID=36814 RepID=A0A1X0IKB1_MYCRH|nr:hypothetical protein BST42_27370 [Mycolicibacterium rhodesiae]
MRPRGIRLWHVVAATVVFFAAMLFAGLEIAATASGSPTCTNVGPTTTVCQSPGNAQITTSPGTIATPNWGWPFWGGGLVISIGG